jgi:hypothetical protein
LSALSIASRPTSSPTVRRSDPDGIIDGENILSGSQSRERAITGL